MAWRVVNGSTYAVTRVVTRMRLRQHGTLRLCCVSFLRSTSAKMRH